MGLATEAVRLHKEGKTPAEIAASLGVPQERVEAFLTARQKLLDNPNVGIVRAALGRLAGKE